MIPGMGHDGHDIWHHLAVVRGWWSAISHHLDHHIWHTFLWKIPFAALSANKKQSWQQTCRHLTMKSHLFAAAMPKKRPKSAAFPQDPLKCDPFLESHDQNMSHFETLLVYPNVVSHLFFSYLHQTKWAIAHPEPSTFPFEFFRCSK